MMNENGVHIQSWNTVIADPSSLNGMVMSADMAFNMSGKLAIRTSNDGKVIRIRSNPDRPNPTFVQGESIDQVAKTIVGDVLGYDLNNYSLQGSEIPDSVFYADEGLSQSQSFYVEPSDDEGSVEFKWIRKQSSEGTGPEVLSISLLPEIREFENAGGFSTKFGYQIKSFSARNILENEDLGHFDADSFGVFAYTMIVLAILLAILILTVGIINVFRGKVEWRRALVVFFGIFVAFFGWRILFYFDVFGPLLEPGGKFIITINSLLSGIGFALYGALAYISWEAFARNQKMGEVEIVDAFWQRKFLVKEAGASLIHGFFIGGVLLGIFALGLYLHDTFFLQYDSQFGFTEASNRFKLISINLTLFGTTSLIVLGQVGFVYGFSHHWIKKNYLALIIALVISAFLITIVGRLVSTPLTVWEDLSVYSFLAMILVMTYRYWGIVTVAVAWFTFSAVIMIMPYAGSQNFEMATMWWVEVSMLFSIPLFGFIVYRYGFALSEIGDYIPEYQERMAQHLRVEREIEIARESQYKLMPLQPPTGDGFDVYGFFLPSFEVGGDYFDYVLSKDEEGKPKALTMAVVDVSGKAMRAAMPAIFTSGLLLSKMKTETPAQILSGVSEPIFTRTDKRTFITCLVARYDLNSQKLSVANAGHCKPVILRQGKAEFVNTPEPRFPLGVKEEVHYRAHEFELEKGDVFLMYSDGLPEAVNEQGERFGFDNVPKLIESLNAENLTASEIAQEIKRRVQKFSNYQLADDTTVICLKV